jgi:hypothetical protein
MILPTQAMRPSLVKPKLSFRQVIPRRHFARGSSGRGWFKQYEEEGPESFVRHAPPTPFDWAKAGQTCKACFDITINNEPAGVVKIELLEELLPVTVSNFKVTSDLCLSVHFRCLTRVLWITP